MQRDREPNGWKFQKKFGEDFPGGQPSIWRWVLQGDLRLSLLLIREPEMRRFEMARVLTNRIMAEQMVTSLRPQAIEAVSQGRNWTDAFWVGTSPQELEEFCAESRLPLPSHYRNYWDEAA